jgi:hypothetical protein
VADLPDYATERLAEQWPPDPAVLAVVRQFTDVRTAPCSWRTTTTSCSRTGRWRRP